MNTHTHTHVYIYIYIYKLINKKKESERKLNCVGYVGNIKKKKSKQTTQNNTYIGHIVISPFVLFVFCLAPFRFFFLLLFRYLFYEFLKSLLIQIKMATFNQSKKNAFE